MYPNAYFDVGSALHYHGPSSARLLAEAMEVAPFTKLLYSSDAFAVAEMVMALEGARPHLEKTAEDWSNGVDHGGLWPAKLVATKHHAVEAAKRVVDLAMEVSGGSGMFRSSELERLYRDVRCGGFHPANTALAHEIVGKTALGVLADPQRW